MIMIKEKDFCDIYLKLCNEIINNYIDNTMDEVRYAHGVSDDKSEFAISIRNVCFELENPISCRFVNEVRSPKRSAGWREGLMLFNPSNEIKYMPWYKPFSRDGVHSCSMYGQHIYPYLKKICNKLRKTNFKTRQCVFTIYQNKFNVWDRDETDVPCNLLGIFDVIDNKLNLTLILRSNDIYLGTPYNIQMFCFLQQVIATELGLELGTYTHFVRNLHCYLRDIKIIEESLYTPFKPAYMFVRYNLKEAIAEAKKYTQYIDENIKSGVDPRGTYYKTY